MENEIVKLTPKEILNKESNDLARQLVEETDPDKVNDLTNLFLMNHKKKELIRLNKLSSIADRIDDEIDTRLIDPMDMADKDLIGYANAVQKSISSVEQNISEAPLIQINNQTNEVHIEDSGLNRASRQRVLDAVMEILNQSRVPDEIINVDEEE